MRGPGHLLFSSVQAPPGGRTLDLHPHSAGIGVGVEVMLGFGGWTWGVRWDTVQREAPAGLQI